MTEKSVTFSGIEPTIYDLSDYNICSFEKNEKNSDRVKRLFSLLKLNDLNGLEFQSIKNICAKYADIFYLEGDRLTTTDVYTHNIFF